ncbi:hypothetical protein [Argonema antarcticum]|uniref:hypothetical protein n=1 Tax=Argonema antarcticum TaxID=2942763 RepID=UPI002012B915|nr:hypothetical protein [Argonema antarcticum]MCL1471592.1 hypothetical protein [Argonema antarcticum A004/B2]
MKLAILNAALLLAINFPVGWVEVTKPNKPSVLGFTIVQPNLQSIQSQPTISNLTDGNYRFCSEPPSLDRNFEEVGWCFIFRKTANRVVGEYFAAQKEQTICITGVLNNNTVSGTGLENWYGWDKPVSLEGIPEREWWDSPEIGGGRLKASRLSIVSRSDDANSYSAWIQYNSVLLNLNKFHRYTAGNRLPPVKCETS